MPRVVMFSPSSPGADGMPERGQVVEELGVDEVHLAQVGRGGVLGDPVQVLDRGARVRVTGHAVTLDQLDLGDRLLAEVVDRAPVHGEHA